MSNSLPWPALGAVTLPLVGSTLVSYYLGGTPGPWAETLKTPKWRPPRMAFPIVWSGLYTGMGYASYLVWKDGGGFEGPAQLPLAMYGAQLALNFSWSPIFFGMHSLKGAFINILLLDVAAAWTAYRFHEVTPLAGYLMLPYLVWLSLATALNYRIWQDNSDDETKTD
uniref:Translocator protein n=1 Tax=Graphocephala atropunctata TaxID=36148 RepID=A0A1B6MSK1_9HEMI